MTEHPIPFSTKPNIYTSPHPASYMLYFNEAVEEYSVPPELLAVVLQLENNYPKYGYLGYLRRSLKMMSAPILQLIDPGHDYGYGYSQGLGNIKPLTAQEVSEYFELCYPGGQSVEGYSSHFVLLDMRTNLRYAAAHLRMQIDAVYGIGYEGPMSLEGLAHVISKYNRSDISYISSYGADGRALLVAASQSEETLYFLQNQLFPPW